MKTLVTVIALGLLFLSSLHSTAQTSSFNQKLADSLQADEYGMKKYVLVLLKTGPKRDQDSATAAAIQAGHMKNINTLAESGKLIVAGPFLDKGDLRGIFILNVATLEEAQKLTEADPAVQSGRLIMELHPWYGSAALPLVTPLHNHVAKKNH